MAYQESFDVHSRGRGTIEITAEVARIVRAAGSGDRHRARLCPAHELFAGADRERRPLGAP
jgi:hypothetical protein